MSRDKEPTESVLRTYRCSSCAHEFDGHHADALETVLTGLGRSEDLISSVRGDQRRRRVPEMGLFGSLLTFAAGIAGSIVGAASVNTFHGRCPKCGSEATEVVPAHRTVVDYSGVERIVSRGISLSVQGGGRTLEKYWANHHHYGCNEEYWQTAHRCGKSTHSMATHRMAASEILSLLTEEARNSIASAPEVDWSFVILQREIYRKSPRYVREATRHRCQAVLDGSSSTDVRLFGQFPNPSAETARALMRQISFVDSE